MPLIRPPEGADATIFIHRLFLRTEQAIIDEITRKRERGYVDYAEVAALERVQATLNGMIDESFDYVPQMIEKIFYKNSEKHAAGYKNARAVASVSAGQQNIIEMLTNNLLGEIVEAAQTSMNSARAYVLARQEADPYRSTVLRAVLQKEAEGKGAAEAGKRAEQALRAQGITAFVDKAGRRWSLTDYCNMASRTTARQAEVAAVLTATDNDLVQIVKIGSTCPLCAALEGRVYSKSGQNTNYPPLSLAFGKIDPNGGDELTNTYLNIHPNCLHSLVDFDEFAYSDAELKKIRDFSSPEKNPLNRDPRSKKQIEAYREKERRRAKLLREMRKEREEKAARERIKGIDVTKEYTDGGNKKTGKLALDPDYDITTHQNEFTTANLILQKCGGEIRLLSESKIEGQKTPDFLWNGKYWELKTVSTEKSANTAIKRGLLQISEKAGGIILNYETRNINIESLEKIIDKRMRRDYTADIMILQNGEVKKVLRYKK